MLCVVNQNYDTKIIKYQYLSLDNKIIPIYYKYSSQRNLYINIIVIVVLYPSGQP